jgi:Arc/MetJ-type ribon-helix-helix transcriptional regulator
MTTGRGSPHTRYVSVRPQFTLPVEYDRAIDAVVAREGLASRSAAVRFLVDYYRERETLPTR